MTTASVTSKGQIVIPAEIRKRLKIKKGTRLNVIEREGSIVLQPVNLDYFMEKAGLAGKGPDLVQMLRQERARERKREDRKSA